MHAHARMAENSILQLKNQSFSYSAIAMNFLTTSASSMFPEISSFRCHERSRPLCRSLDDSDWGHFCGSWSSFCWMNVLHIYMCLGLDSDRYKRYSFNHPHSFHLTSVQLIELQCKVHKFLSPSCGYKNNYIRT